MSRPPEVPTRLVLVAPLSGPLVPLEQVPDPVFSQKLVGDGVSIDPESACLRAPCDGRVAHVHASGHAVNLAAAGGVEVIIHVGLDTVELKGEGFLTRVAAGDQVHTGDPLIEFAADYVATHAKSLLTQVVVAASDRVLGLEARTGRVAAGDPILELRLAPDGERRAAEPAGDAGPALVSDPVPIALATGLHARPAAVVAATAKRFRGRVRLLRRDASANAKSVTSIMSLEVAPGDAVRVEATGPDAGDAIAALTALLATGLGEEGEAAARPQPAPRPGAEAHTPGPALDAAVAAETGGAPRAGDPRLLFGVSASPGLAIGRVVQLHREEIAIDEGAGDPAQERQRLERALEQGRLQLEALQARLRAEADPGKAAIFAAHAEVLDDPDVVEQAMEAIAGGHGAALAWRDAFSAHAARLAASRNELLAARADDVRDVGRRVLRLLAGPEAGAAPAAVGEQSILVAEDLTPSETAGLDRSKVLGFCTVGGGATSHVVILARSLGIPAVVGMEPRALDVRDGTPAILDGGRGTLRVEPDASELAAVRETQARFEARRRSDAAAAREAAVTRDGRRVEVAANVGGLEDVEQAVALGGEGVGLLRTEFLFLDRPNPPTEEEQLEAYGAIARALGPERPLVIRVVDAGGDKPLPYLPVPREDNPFLGVRGLRLLLDRPEVLRTQLRAMLRAAAVGRVSIMFPMVATLSEWRTARAMVEEERRRTGAGSVPVGIMVEIPAVAVMADAFARETDFFSIGSNDLTQYTLAMDRGHPKLAPFVDGLHPAVLRLIQQAAQAAAARGKWTGVCGGIASDPEAAAILVGLGITELSVSVPVIPSIKARVRELDTVECRALAERALAADTAAEVRALVRDAS
jgi:phosphocarrier protein FPr